MDNLYKCHICGKWFVSKNKLNNADNSIYEKCAEKFKPKNKKKEG